MRKAIVPAAGIALIASLLTAILGITPARAATFKYDFEKCEQGWKAQASDTWKRSDMLGGGEDSTWAVEYLVYKDGHERATTITSLPHIWPGGKQKISYDTRFQTEPGDYGPAGTAADKVVFERSTDGGKNWKLVKAHNLLSAGFPEFERVEMSVDLPAGPVLFRFGLISDTNTPGLGFQFDNLTVPTAAPDGAVCK